jgi:hypothetical protein
VRLSLPSQAKPGKTRLAAFGLIGAGSACLGLALLFLTGAVDGSGSTLGPAGLGAILALAAFVLALSGVIKLVRGTMS